VFKGELNSDFAFNSAASYASLDGLEKVAAKKLKESYQLAKESGEENNHKFIALSSYIAAKLFSKQLNFTEFDEDELKVTKEEPTKFDTAINDLVYLNNTV